MLNLEKLSDLIYSVAMRNRTKKKIKYTENPQTIYEYADNQKIIARYHKKLERKAIRKKWLLDNIVAIVVGVVTIAITIIFEILHLMNIM